MMSVAVVDDKKFIRKGILSLLAKSGLELGELFEFGNGREALEFFRTAAVDLVVTDIRMPQLDGLSLMEKAMELEQPPKFIVLSEFDDFRYAQKSIEHGAKAYILKPIDKLELIKVVSKVEEEIKREKGILLKEDQMKAKEKRLMKEEFRLALLSGIHSDGMLEKLEQKGFLSGQSPFCVALVIYAGTEYPQGNGLLLSGLNRLIQDGAESGTEPYMTLEMGAMALIVAHSSDRIRELIDQVNRKERLGVAAVSERCESGRELREGYLQALEVLKYRYLFPEQDLIRYADIAGLNAEYTLPTGEIEKLCLLIGTGKLTLLDETVSAIFDRATIIRCKIEYVEGTVKAFYNSLTSIVSVLSYKWSDELKKYEILSDLYRFGSMKEYLSLAVEFVHRIDRYISAMKNAYHNNNEIEKAIEYIGNNYDKDINLTTVSNYVSMNYSYFSHLFRAKMGVSFVEYLRKIRINKSMELLSGTQMKISEISDKVGFNSYKQFTRAFVDTVGISPVVYREQKQAMERMMEQSVRK